MSPDRPGPSVVLAATIRGGHPDFLDLPWPQHFDNWAAHTSRLEQLPRGQSRHSVVFVSYAGVAYCLKELPTGLAEREFSLLREMEDKRLPVVTPVGHLRIRRADGDVSVVVTRYLEHSLPYHALFMGESLVRYRQHLLDAMACLLVQLHLGGVFWGDCSLSNTLFRRDAGRLTAYLVDAETSEVHPQLSSGQRGHDLDLMEENVFAGLLDLQAVQAIAPHIQVEKVGPYIRQRYDALWSQVTSEQMVSARESYQVQERVRALNALGFSVDQIELITTASGQQLRMRMCVTDRSFHRDLLHSLTGLVTEEMQARTLLNEIEELRSGPGREQDRDVPLSAAAYRWFTRRYVPTIERLGAARFAAADPVELYCQVLEHKWYMSERERRDVGHEAATTDYLQRFGIIARPVVTPNGGIPTPDAVSRATRRNPLPRWWRVGLLARRAWRRIRRWRPD